MALKMRRAARLALLDRFSPPLLFAVAEVCDQTWCYVTADGCLTTKYRDALLLRTREGAKELIAKRAEETEAWLRKVTTSDNADFPHLNDADLQGFYRRQLALPREERFGNGWVEEVRGEATWRANKDTW